MRAFWRTLESLDFLILARRHFVQLDVLGLTGASAALHISQLPFDGPLAGVRVGRIDGKFLVNPSPAQCEKSDLELIVAGTKESIVMVEGGAKIVPENEILDALYFGHGEIQKLIAAQEELRNKIGKEKEGFVPEPENTELIEKVKSIVGDQLATALRVKDKLERKDAIKAISTQVSEELEEEYPEDGEKVSEIFSSLTKKASRELTLSGDGRLDGRDNTTVRPIECEVGFVPRAHGSSLFTRGETQAIVTTTLGTSVDSQRIDSLMNQEEKKFLLHYNFPPYSVGEARMLRGTSRREVGHGALAERALRPVVPADDDFPYVIRIVSDITESNGSSSMASVCGGSLSMMDAGVKIKAPVGGVAMGLIKEGDRVAVLTDILGDEDHFGDMDFKVCGTDQGITALQMDIKCQGLDKETMTNALNQARDARLHILENMNKALSEARDDVSEFAPRIITIKINPDKIRDVIGPGGKTIRSIVESTGVKIDISDDGSVVIASSDRDASKRAIEIIEGLTEEAEIGKVYTGMVKRIMDFGAFVEILPNVEGLVHISQLAPHRVEQVTDILKEGDEVPVRVLDIDRQGRIRLSRKDALEQ
ncbi:polyribonucleotide nucleotidyltransferase [bacterium J17]|nr:polyribonucleotide nucleotidyltransferase [bacterium J17]